MRIAGGNGRDLPEAGRNCHLAVKTIRAHDVPTLQHQAMAGSSGGGNHVVRGFGTHLGS